MVEHVHTVEEFDEKTKEGKVLVDFFATWCGPCQMLSPIIERVANSHPEIKVLKVDTDELSEVAIRYRIASIPTLYLFEDGVKTKETMGYQPESSVLKFLGL